jgi:hypothetical protein
MPMDSSQDRVPSFEGWIESLPKIGIPAPSDGAGDSTIRFVKKDSTSLPGAYCSTVLACACTHQWMIWCVAGHARLGETGAHIPHRSTEARHPSLLQLKIGQEIPDDVPCIEGRGILHIGKNANPSLGTEI